LRVGSTRFAEGDSIENRQKTTEFTDERLSQDKDRDSSASLSVR
jgi:hypothetical protein